MLYCPYMWKCCLATEWCTIQGIFPPCNQCSQDWVHHGADKDKAFPEDELNRNWLIHFTFALFDWQFDPVQLTIETTPSEAPPPTSKEVHCHGKDPSSPTSYSPYLVINWIRPWLLTSFNKVVLFSLSHSLCFPIYRVCVWAFFERTLRTDSSDSRRWGDMCWIRQKVYWIKIHHCTFKGLA